MIHLALAGERAADLRRRPPAARLHLHRRRGRRAAALARVAATATAGPTTSAAASARRSSTWRARSSRSPAADALEFVAVAAAGGADRDRRFRRRHRAHSSARLGWEPRVPLADGLRRTVGVLPGRDVCVSATRGSACVYLAHAFMVGGAEEMVLNLVRHLPPRFEPIGLLHPRGGSDRRGDPRARGRRSSCSASRPGCGGRSTSSAFAGTFARREPQIVHTFLLTASLYGRLAAILARVPIVIGTEVNIYERKRPHPRAGRAAADGGHRSRRRLRRVGARLLHQAGARRSGEGRRDLQRGRLRTGAADDAARARCARSLGVPPDAPVAGIIARLTEQKGHRYPVRRARVDAGARATFICWSSAAAICATSSNARAESLGLSSRVHFLGRAARSRRSARGDGRVRDAVALGRAAAVAGAGDGRGRAGRGDRGRRHSRSRRGRPDRPAGAAAATRRRSAPRWRGCSSDSALRGAHRRATRARIGAAALRRRRLRGLRSSALYDRLLREAA